MKPFVLSFSDTYNWGFHKKPRNTQTHIILVLMLFSTKFKQQRF